MTTDEYANALNVWLQQCHYWQLWVRSTSAACIQTSLLVGQQQLFTALQQQQQQQQQRGLNNNVGDQTTPVSDVVNPNADNVRRRRNWLSTVLERLIPIRGINVAAVGEPRPENDAVIVDQSAVPVLVELGGREYRVPSVWKRFSAEFVDFVILFLLKLFITFVVIDLFDVIDLEKYDLASFQHLQNGTIDYKFALKITSEFFVLELIHRVIVCFFEALCLHQGTNGVGGATPGKSLLGLRVVSCETVLRVRNGQIVVWPSGDIGFGWALLRSVIKNFAMALFLPACITMFFFPYNRTIYDIICGCIVVEDIRPAQRF